MVYVETPDLMRLSRAERNRRIAVLRLATSLGAEAITLGGSSAAAELLAVRAHAQCHAVPGRAGPTGRAGGACCAPSTTDQLLSARRDIDVLVIGGA